MLEVGKFFLGQVKGHQKGQGGDTIGSLDVPTSYLNQYCGMHVYFW